MKIKVAIIQLIDYYDRAFDTEIHLERNVTEWVEVNESEYNDLKDGIDLINNPYYNKQYNHAIYHKLIVFPLGIDGTQNELVLKTIADYKEHINVLNKKREAEREFAAKKIADRKLKRELKAKEKREQLFNEMKKEFEGE